MAQQVFTEEMLPKLREWFEYNCSTGCTPDQLKETLVDAGYRPRDVDAFLEAQLALWSQRQAEGALFDADPVAGDEDAIARLWQRAEVLGAFNQIALGDRTAQLLAKNPRYGIFYIAGFLSEEECEGLIAEARPRLADSTIVDESDGAHVKTNTRSSRGAMLQRGASDLVRRVESRIAKLTALPSAHGEGLQILHYGVGGEYRPHFDFFDPKTVGGARVLEQGSQRLATVIMYLSEVEAGGGTLFPELALEITPTAGAALLFASIGRDGGLLETSLHAGLPVTSGEKWIATKWLRLSPHQRRR